MGAEKIAHACIEEHWMKENITVLKVDMKNAFKLVFRQALLSECAKHFPELYPWAHWCYSQHPPILVAHDGEFDIRVWCPTR